MSPFELVFALFGLLLGLAIAEVLGGFARVLKLKRAGRAEVRIGWLTPLLGLLVILDLTSFWLVAWNVRELIPANYATLILVLTIVGAYYLAATLIFPEDPETWPDFDMHYDKQNRLVLATMLFANVAVLVFSIAVAAGAIAAGRAPSAPPSEAGALAAVSALLPFVLLIALIFIKSRRVNTMLLLIMIALNLAGALVGAAA